MNKRKGLRRLALAVGLPYFGWWALIGKINYDVVRSTEARISKSSAEANSDEMASLFRLNALANTNLTEAITWGVFVPVVALIVVAVGYWIYRGFKSDA